MGGWAGPLRLGQWQDTYVTAFCQWLLSPGSDTPKVGCDPGPARVGVGVAGGGVPYSARAVTFTYARTVPAPFPPPYKQRHTAAAHVMSGAKPPHLSYCTCTLYFLLRLRFIFFVRVSCAMFILYIYVYLNYEVLIFEPWSVVECHFVPHHCDLECPSRLTFFPVEP